jgi:hypothetical protein
VLGPAFPYSVIQQIASLGLAFPDGSLHPLAEAFVGKMANSLISALLAPGTAPAATVSQPRNSERGEQ